jgi:hypothetical protein
MTLNELAKAAGKSVPFILNLISGFGLTKTKEFSPGYAVLIKKLIALSLCSVAKKDIETLLARERTLLELLKADSLSGGAAWFEDLCIPDCGPTRLLLSGYDLGHPVTADGLQTGLDFVKREEELFSHQEMGADALRALKLYAEIHKTVFERLQTEAPVLSSSLKWVRRVCGKRQGSRSLKG